MAKLDLEHASVGTLDDVCLSIGPGEIVCLSGVSGSGKSRLLRAIADLDPHGGEIRLDDTAQEQVSGHRWRRAVVLVPTESQWWFDTVKEHLPRPMPEALAALGFGDEAAGWAISRLSSGEKQRLALIRALSHAPRALLLDEPTANLDATATLRTERWLCSWIREHQLPVLWVAHDPDQIRRVARRHFRIEGSRLVEQPWA